MKNIHILPTEQLFTDHPITELGDEEYKEAPIRECELLSYDDNKYCYVKVEGIEKEIKRCYIYSQRGRCGEVDCISVDEIKELLKEEPKKVLTEKDIFNQKDIDAVTDYINKEQQKQALIEMMKSDEELGLYDDTEINRIELVCKDCSDSLEDCTCIKSTIDFPKQEIKLEEVFNDDKKENIKKFIDEINNPSQPNQALKDAFEKYSEYLEDFENKNTYEHGFKDGAKWQQEQYTIEEQHVGHTIDELDKEYIKGFNEGSAYYIERMYSEEEVIAFGEFIFKNTLLTHAKGVKSLFEQFKKK